MGFENRREAAPVSIESRSNGYRNTVNLRARGEEARLKGKLMHLKSSPHTGIEEKLYTQAQGRNTPKKCQRVPNSNMTVGCFGWLSPAHSQPAKTGKGGLSSLPLSLLFIYVLIYLFIVVLGVRPRRSHLVGKCFPIELNSLNRVFLYSV